jgi:hypothetical protein
MGTASRPLIRLSKQSYATLKAMSKETKKPMSDIAAEAIERYSDDRFWDEVDRELAAMTPEQWRQYRKEFEEWDAIPGPAIPADDWSEQRRAEQGKANATVRGRVVGRSRSSSRTRAGRPEARRRPVG